MPNETLLQRLHNDYSHLKVKHSLLHEEHKRQIQRNKDKSNEITHLKNTLAQLRKDYKELTTLYDKLKNNNDNSRN